MRIKLLVAVLIVALILAVSACSKTQARGDLEGHYIDGDDVHISQDGAKIIDMNIIGNLYIDESVGDGEFYIENCTIEGDIYVNGGGPNSGYFVNVIGKRLLIESQTNPNLILDMGTSLDSIQIATDCKLVTDGNGVKQVSINNRKTEKAISVLMKGEYPEVSIESTAKVKIDGKVSLLTVLKRAGMTSIDMVDTSKVYYYSCYGQSVSIHGGSIVEAWINAEYCSLPANVESINSEVGVTTVTVGEADISIIPTSKPTSQEEKANQDKDFQSDVDVEESMKMPGGKTDSNKESHEGASGENKAPEPDNSKDEDKDLVDTFVDASKPSFSSNGTKKTISLVVNEPCKVYVMVEGQQYFSRGTTPERVRDGISAGASNPDYTVIHAAFDAKKLNSKISFVVDMKDYGLEEGGFGEGVFVVLEDMLGNLTKVYSFK